MHFNLMFNSFILGIIGGAIFAVAYELIRAILFPMYHKEVFKRQLRQARIDRDKYK